MNEIFWPEDYIPGFTDNFVSNEVIVAGLSAMDVWLFLSNAPLWPTYYSNSANIRFYANQFEKKLQLSGPTPPKAASAWQLGTLRSGCANLPTTTRGSSPAGSSLTPN